MATTVLLADQVLTGLDKAPIANGGVRISGGRIESVGPRDELRREDAEVIEFAGATLLPGLIDCHEHLSGHDRYAIGDSTVNEPDIVYGLVGTYHARRLLDEGITTARVPGAPGHIDLMIRRAIDEGYVDGPRLVCAGRNLSMTGGHGSTSGMEVDGPDAAARAARAQLKVGADFIKVVASGGVGITRKGELPSQPELTVDEMRAAVEIAHNAQRRVTAHADGVPGIQNALDAGVDCVEHGIYLNGPQAEFMAERGVALVPTLSTMVGIAKRGLEYGMPQTWIPIAEEILEPHRASFQHALDAGVLYGAGTDGFGNLVDEIQIIASFDVPPYRAIQSATRDAARVISDTADFGVLEPGAAADVIVVGGDPLDDLESLRDVRYVMVEGVVKRDRRPAAK